MSAGKALTGCPFGWRKAEQMKELKKEAGLAVQSQEDNNVQLRYWVAEPEDQDAEYCAESHSYAGHSPSLER